MILYDETMFEGAGIWPDIRIALKSDVRIAGSIEPPNFRRLLVRRSGPAASSVVESE